MLNDHFRVVDYVVDVVLGATDVVCVGVEGMPVVHVVELQMDAIVIVIAVLKQQVWLVDYLEVIVGQVVDIVLDDYLYELS